MLRLHERELEQQRLVNGHGKVRHNTAQHSTAGERKSWRQQVSILNSMTAAVGVVRVGVVVVTVELVKVEGGMTTGVSVEEWQCEQRELSR